MPLAAKVNLNRMAFARNSLDTDGNSISEDTNKLKEATRAKMIENLSFFINVVENLDMDEICNTFHIECKMYPTLRGISRSEDILLTILNESADVCYRFKEYMLATDQKKAIDGLMRPSDDDIPVSFKEKYKDVTVQNIIGIRDYLAVNLEVRTLLLPLLEKGVLPLDKYISIRSQRSLDDKKRCLLSFLIDRSESDWVTRFLYVLHKNHQTDILKSLKTGETTEIINDLVVAISRTNIIVKSTEIPDRSAEDLNIISESELNMLLLDIRRSSIVLRLQVRSEEDLCVLIDSTARLERFFQKMYANLKPEKSEKRPFFVTIQKIPKHQFIQYRKFANGKRETEESDNCLMCLQEIVRTNVRTFVAEIESDIIQQTFDNAPEINTFVKNMCLDKQITPSRQQRAIKFLTYVLHDEKCLFTFYKIFLSTSNSEIIPIKCTKCLQSVLPAPESDSCMDKLKEIAMNFVLYKENGHVFVKRVEIPNPNNMVPGTATRIDQVPMEIRQTSPKIIHSGEYQKRNEEVVINEKPRLIRLKNSHTVLENKHHIRRQRSMPELRANRIQDNQRVLEILEEQSEEIHKLKTFVAGLDIKNIKLQEGIRNMMNERLNYRGDNGHRLQVYE